jgi:MoaA/NifB/PqqE/SkfB family radical SAM enzyme
VIEGNGHRRLTGQEWIDIGTELVRSGVRRLHVCGKEPLLEPWLERFFLALHDLRNFHRFRCGLVTNGTLLEENLPWMERLSIDYIDISIDGLERGHDRLRGDGSFARSASQIATAVSRLGSRKVNLATVACSDNVGEIPKMVEAFSRMGIVYFFIQPVKLLGRAAQNPGLGLSPEAFLDLIDALTTMQTRQEVLLEVFIDYAYKDFLFESCELFRRRCRGRLSGKDLAFRIPSGTLQLTANWECYAYSSSCLITPFGEFLGCSVQATQDPSIGPSAGFVFDYPIPSLIRRGYRIGARSGLQARDTERRRSRPQNLLGITRCPLDGLSGPRKGVS